MTKFASVDMTDGVPWKKLMLFTVPLLIGNVFQQLYSTVDAIFLGRFVGDNALAAIGSSMAIFFLILMLVMGVAIGAGIMTSQYFGAKRREDLSYTIGTSITLTAIVGLFLTIFGPLATRPVLILLETPTEILEDSVLYMNVLLWGILGLAYFNMFSGLLRGMGEAIAPLIYLIIASVLNIALNFVFIVVLGMGVFGAAIGTVIAQAFTSVLCLRKLMKMRDVFDMGWKYLIPQRKYVRQVLKLGIPSGVSQAIFAVAMMIVQPLVNGFGPTFIAVYIIVMRIDGFVVMPAFSFGNAITVYTGQNVGAGKMDRVDKGIKQCIIMALAVAVVLVSGVLAFGRGIAGAFTETQQVIDMTMQMLWILALGYVAFSANIVVWGVIRGAGDAISPLWGALINSVVVRLPTAFLFVHLLGTPDAIMYSLLAAWISNLIIAIIVLKIGKWRKMGLIRKQET
ncbi:MAG: MATE family efflux transporter [Oscillospiraceae bacterium]|nr:MATE family efflux transporter [Oscillospiraceae bacterium]